MLSCEDCGEPTVLLITWLVEKEIDHLCMACHLARQIQILQALEAQAESGELPVAAGT